MALIDDVKLALRVTSASLNTEVTDLINAAEEDLQVTAIDELMFDETSPLIKQAIIAYVKANFGYNNPEAERFMATYESIKRTLALVEKYAVE